MAAISLRGYWRTLIVFIACKPAMRMTKLTTIASTGRLMNKSVKDFILNVGHSERSEAESKLQRRRRSRPSQAFHSRYVTFKVPLRDRSTFTPDADAALASMRVHLTNRRALDLSAVSGRDRYLSLPPSRCAI